VTSKGLSSCLTIWQVIMLMEECMALCGFGRRPQRGHPATAQPRGQRQRPWRNAWHHAACGFEIWQRRVVQLLLDQGPTTGEDTRAHYTRLRRFVQLLLHHRAAVVRKGRQQQGFQGGSALQSPIPMANSLLSSRSNRSAGPSSQMGPQPLTNFPVKRTHRRRQPSHFKTTHAP
jgi:hypothetical protein